MYFAVLVPRFWFSRRWRLAILGFVGLLIVSCQRISIEVAIDSMLNQTTLANSSSSERLDRSYPATGLFGLPSAAAEGGSAFAAAAAASSVERGGEFAMVDYHYGGASGTLGRDLDYGADKATATAATTPSKSSRDLVVLHSRMDGSCSNASEFFILNSSFFQMKLVRNRLHCVFLKVLCCGS